MTKCFLYYDFFLNIHFITRFFFVFLCAGSAVFFYLLKAHGFYYYYDVALFISCILKVSQHLSILVFLPFFPLSFKAQYYSTLKNLYSFCRCCSFTIKIIIAWINCLSYGVTIKSLNSIPTDRETSRARKFQLTNYKNVIKYNFDNHNMFIIVLKLCHYFACSMPCLQG